MKKITPKQRALIHVAKSRLGMSEADYRDLLGQFGVKSSNDLSQAQFKELLECFVELGFEAPEFKPATRMGRDVKRLQWLGDSQKATGQKATGSPHTLLTDKQRQRIYDLWEQVSTAPEERREAALNSFCKKITKVDHLNWLTVKKAQHLIFVMEKMAGERKN